MARGMFARGRREEGVGGGGGGKGGSGVPARKLYEPHFEELQATRGPRKTEWLFSGGKNLTVGGGGGGGGFLLHRGGVKKTISL